MKKKISLFLPCVVLFSCFTPAFGQAPGVPKVFHNAIGDSLVCENREVVLTCIEQKHGHRYPKDRTFDADIFSPKSVSFTPDGRKVYVNSLEGGMTVVYDTDNFQKLKVIKHRFDSGEGEKWLKPSGYYPFTHYPDGMKKSFMGKPVEEAFSPDARYMFVPYYRRTFDLNAQDPSALAVIDTQTDSIILMTETGPLPKMVAVSGNGNLLAITHWGDNTVGFLDISDPNPKKWKHLPYVTVGSKLKLDYSLTEPVDRDTGSGFALRGTAFLPGDSLMLVSGMGGPMAVIDIKKMKWLGMIPEFSLIRHITIKNGKVFMSRNNNGEILSVPVDSVVDAVTAQKGSKRNFKIGGVKKGVAGKGARTLKVSPDGKYIFVACNFVSAVYVMRAEDMKIIGSITVDSFPVGLDLSPDGTILAVTSQGRKGEGGNAVNFFKVDYKEKPVAGSEKKDAGVFPEGLDDVLKKMGSVLPYFPDMNKYLNPHGASR